MTRTFHLCMDIRNALLTSTDKELGTMLIEKGGRKLSAQQTKEFLLDELAKGRKFLPCVPCDGFDYQAGCPGHPESAIDLMRSENYERS